MNSLSHRLAIAVLFCFAAANSSLAAIEYANITGGRVHQDSQMAMIFSDSSRSQPLPHIAGFKALDALLRCVKPENESSHTH
jgi:hypothetical protein